MVEFREALENWKKACQEHGIEPWRQTGQTRDMLLKAQAKLREGWKVVLVFPNEQMKDWGQRKLIELEGTTSGRHWSPGNAVFTTIRSSLTCILGLSHYTVMIDHACWESDPYVTAKAVVQLWPIPLNHGG